MELTTQQVEHRRLSELAEQNAYKLDRAKKLQNYHPLYTIFASTIASIIELIFLYPFEFMKTYSQFSPGVTRYSVYHQPMRAAITYMKERGIHGFYIGSQPLMIASFLKSFVRMSAYDITAKQSDPQRKRRFLPLYGMIAAFLECIISLPFDNIKNHMSHSAYMRVLEPGHQTFVKIVERQGMKAFFRGFWPSLWSYSLSYSIRMSIFTVCLPIFDQWAAQRGQLLYEQLKKQAVDGLDPSSFDPNNPNSLKLPTASNQTKEYQLINEYKYVRPFVGTVIIGSAATATSVWLTMPLDNIKTKLQSPERPLYRGTMHCLTQSIKNYGVKSLWRGTTPRLVRNMLSTPLFITMYDALLDQMGSSGPHPTTSMGRLDC